MNRQSTALTQLALPFVPAETTAPDASVASSEPPVGAATPAALPPLTIVRRRGTRRYILRLLDDGTLRVTVPWWGSQRGARAFVESERAWVIRQVARRAARVPCAWAPGRQVLVDGVPHPLVSDAHGVQLRSEYVSASIESAAIRTGVVRALRRLAHETLPRELDALAARHGITVTRVSIRNQSARWGSCSPDGAISLNWRLVQTPPFVREYVLLHELMHRRQMNHSPRFWRLVADVCPRYLEARKWLRVEGHALFGR